MMVLIWHLIRTFVVLSEDTAGHDNGEFGISILRNVSWDEAVSSCLKLNKTLPMDTESNVLSILKLNSIDRVWLGMEPVETDWSWSNDPQAHSVYPQPLRSNVKGMNCGVVRIETGDIYATSCSTEIEGFICNRNCSDCLKPACFKQLGRCYVNICPRKHVDWYSAAKHCEHYFSGLSTNIVPGQRIKGNGNCSEYWVGLTRDRWKTDDGYMVHYGWLAGLTVQSYRTCAVMSLMPEASRNVSNCTHSTNAVCLPRSSQTGSRRSKVSSTGCELRRTDTETYKWLIGPASLSIPLTLALFLSIGVHLFRKCNQKGIYLISGVQRRNTNNTSNNPPRPVLHSSFISYGSSSASNSMQSQGQVCSMCRQNNQNNTIHYKNMVTSEITRCSACGRLVKPQRPEKPQPTLPLRAPKMPLIALQKTSAIARLRWQEDYENIALGLKAISARDLLVAKVLLVTQTGPSTANWEMDKRRPSSIV